ncbi:ABC transporter substrate-binding protein [Paenibacillus sp. YYML68]|uniref:ABC transporter substrate-binding protein n=1 Tax=Paenibacillus sp. YYML68 TaxID=2909250 RepID=UPI0024920B35|nr:ABC transporter substrate-binding protein [Paenibacillus sp. YYML68]
MNHYWNKGLRTALVLTLAGTLAACGNASNPPQAGKMVDPPTAQGGSAEGNSQAGQGKQTAGERRTVYPYKVTDATGKQFVFEKAPERIASTSPSETELLFALGLGNKVVGVSDFCDYPAEAKSKPKLGSITKPNEEALLGSGAELVLTGVSMKAPTVEKLRELKVNLFQVQPKKIDDVLRNIIVMGEIFDKQNEAHQLVESMKAERDKVVQAVANVKPEERKRVFLEFSPGWTVGSGEFLSELIATAGGENIYASENGYVKLSEEKVIAANPQVILYPRNLIDDKSGKSMDQIIRERSGWEQVDAVKNGKLAGIDKDTTSRPGPRITQGLTEMAKGMYPELVK